MLIFKRVYHAVTDAIGLVATVVVLAIAVPVGFIISKSFRAEVLRVVGRLAGYVREPATTTAGAIMMIVAFPFIVLKAIFGREPPPEYWEAERKKLDDECPPNWG